MSSKKNKSTSQPLTRETLPLLDEASLRREVLVPLFKKMGYKDVYHQHGRALEQGKDLVMWKTEDFGQRANYAVVAKKGDLTGAAAGSATSGSVGVVNTQILQCFGTPYKDPITAEQRYVHRCIVVASGNIGAEFLHSISGLLADSKHANNVSFISGQQLWELIEQHIPEATFVERIEDIRELLLQQLPGFSAQIMIEDDHTLIGVSPPKGPQELDEIKIAIKSDPSQGNPVEQLDTFIKTGKPFSLSRDQLENITFPEKLQKLFGLTKGVLDSITFKKEPAPPVPFRLIRLCDDGDRAEVPLELVCVQGGTEQITLSNESQNVPWKFTLTLRGVQMNLDYAISLTGANAKIALDWLRFQAALAKPGRLSLDQTQTGFQHTALHDKGAGSPPNAKFLDVIRKTAAIQIQTNTIIKVPDRVMPADQKLVSELYDIVTAGQVQAGSITMRIHKGVARKARPNLEKPGVLEIDFPEERAEVLWDTQINLGPSKLRAEQVMIPSNLLAKIDEELANGADDDWVTVTFAPTSERQIQIIYPNWPKDHLSP